MKTYNGNEIADEIDSLHDMIMNRVRHYDDEGLKQWEEHGTTDASKESLAIRDQLREVCTLLHKTSVKYRHS